LGAPHAVLLLRVPDRRGPGADPLLRGRLLGRLRRLHDLRPEDALGRVSADAPSRASAAVAKVHAVTTASEETGLVTGERVTTAAGGFNPTWQRHVAAYEQCSPLLPG